MTNPFLLNLEHRDRLSDEERLIVDRLSARRKKFAAKSDIVVEGTSPKDSCLMVSGFSARSNLLGDGRRQITALHVAGDFVDLHNFLLAKMDHSVVAISDCEIALVSHDLLKEITASQPHFTRLLWLLTVVDSAIYRQWLVASGRLSSKGQVAHLLCEMFTRLKIIGQTNGFAFRLPLNQTELSDAMGLSVVHVNRTLQQMRRDGLIEWLGDAVRILDWNGLQAAAEFDPTYLNFTPSPR